MLKPSVPTDSNMAKHEWKNLPKKIENKKSYIYMSFVRLGWFLV